MNNATDFNETQLKIIGAIDSLPRKYREVIILCDMNGLSLQQIALHVGINEAAAQKRLNRARFCLQQELLKIL